MGQTTPLKPEAIKWLTTFGKSRLNVIVTWTTTDQKCFGSLKSERKCDDNALIGPKKGPSAEYMYEDADRETGHKQFPVFRGPWGPISAN